MRLHLWWLCSIAVSMREVLASVGLESLLPAFERAGLTDERALAAEVHADAAAVNAKLSGLGLKMGQRQKVSVALGKVAPG